MFHYLLKSLKGLADRVLTNCVYLPDEEEYEDLSYWRKKDMLTVIDENTPPDEFEVIDATKSIVMVVKSDGHFIRSKEDGSFDLVADQNYSLNGARVVGNFIEFPYKPRIKMTIPKGLKIHFDSPFDNQTINKIYTDFDVQCKEEERNIVASYIMYNKMHFYLHLDNTRVMTLSKPFSYPLGTPILNFHFQYIYVAEELPTYNKIYLVKNDEVFNNFENYYK
jgi:hypothetical protein